MSLKTFILQNPKLKKITHRLLIPKDEARPRLWVTLFLNRFFHSRGRGVKIRNSVRMDVLPFNGFSIGEASVIEDFSVVNNGVGAVHIGRRSLVGMSNVIIGPVTIGDNVILAQHVVISGLNHEYRDVHSPIRDQPVNTSPVHIGEESWLGANVVITAGVTVGKHSIIAAGSVVTKDVPPFCIAAGNPARIIKRYDFATGEWTREK